MSDLPIDPELSYVSKATFLHLWEKFKQQEKDLAEANSIKESFATNVLRLGNECRDQASQVNGLKEELARVMEDLHRANDILASQRADIKWLASCMVTRRSLYIQQIQAIGSAVCDLADVTPYTAKSKTLWDNYEKAISEATKLFSND